MNGSATVTIDGAAYAFATTGFVAEVCNPDQFGIFFGVMQRVDDSGAAMDGGLLEAILVRDETAAAETGQTESVTVTTGEEDLVWIADAVQVEEREQLEQGQSQVDSTEFTDTTVSGTATFYSEESLFEVTGGLADTVTTADGTFEITCVAG